MSADAQVRTLAADEAAYVMSLLETGFGRGVGAAVENQYLLDALDRGHHDRFVVWPLHDPLAVLYGSPTGAVVPAGDPAGGPALAHGAEQMGWRVLIGDAAVCDALLDAYPRGLFRRRPVAREQRFMVADGTRAATGASSVLRPARTTDLERVTEFAADLHVEDRMGPALSRAARTAVRARMLDSITMGNTWVIEDAGEVVGKIDLSLYSRRRGAQIAGVYVASHARRRGLCGSAIARLTQSLFDEGLPAVTLHVRADNRAAIRAYTRAGFVDRGPWTLAFR